MTFRFFRRFFPKTIQGSEPHPTDSPEFGFRVIVYGTFLFILGGIYWIFVGTIDDVVKLRGRVIPRDGIVNLQAPIGGTIKYLMVKEGSLARKGQVLLQLDPSPFHQQLQVLQKERKLTSEQINKLRLSSGNLGQGLEKQNELLQIEKEIAKTTEILSKTILESPYDCVVASIFATRSGNVVEAGSPIISVFPQNSLFEVEAFAKGADLQKLKLGSLAKVELDAFPYQTFGTIEGVLTSISPGSLSTEKENGSFRIGLLLTETQMAGYSLRPGMEATLWVATEKQTIAKWVWGNLR